MNDDLCAFLGHKVDRRLVDPVRQEDGATDLQDLRGARSGEAGISARCDDEVCVGAVSAEGVLGKVGDAAILEGLSGLQALQVWGVSAGIGHKRRGLTSSLR